MAKRCFNMTFLVVAMVIASLVQHSAAQTTHVVGDSMGWTIRATESVPPPKESMAPGMTNVFKIPSKPLPSPISAPPSSPSSLQQVTYIVGDALYWTVPAYVGANPDFYQIWASNKPFKVGDKLVFNYVSRRHNVAQVDKLGYETCDASFSTLPEYYTSPTSITLDSSGEYFFICDNRNHCFDGQKLAITVTNTASSSPTSSAAGTTSNAASFFYVVEVSATFLSIIVCFFLV